MADKKSLENAISMSQERFDELKERLEYLKGEGREKISQQIATAREFGDLSENAEYDDAKNEQSKLESEIVELEETLRQAVIIQQDEVKTDRVNVGTVVTVHDLNKDIDVQYTLVGEKEADPFQGRISRLSPTGAALLDHKRGETVRFQTPNGERALKIMKIQRSK